MGEGFQRGLWDSGSHGDPDPGATLPPAVADALLNGQPWLVPAEFRLLTDTVAALAGPPSEAELRGEPRARAAYRARGMSRTLPLEIGSLEALPGGRRRRAPRARHRVPASARPPGRRVAGGRVGVVSGIAAAVIAVAGGIAFAAGVFPSHVKDPSPAAVRSSAGPNATTASNAGLNGQGTPVPKVTTPSAQAGATADGPRQWCEEWLKNPWRPGDKEWDKADFDKLTAKAHGPQFVLWYCVKLLPAGYFGAKPGTGYPARYNNGPWWWVPGGKEPGPGIPGAPGSGISGQGGSGGSGNSGNGSGAGSTASSKNIASGSNSSAGKAGQPASANAAKPLPA
jgi:hypothetical protein